MYSSLLMFSLLMVPFLSAGNPPCPVLPQGTEKRPLHTLVQGTRISRGSTLFPLSRKERSGSFPADNGAAVPVRRPLGGGAFRFPGRALSPSAPLSEPFRPEVCPRHRCAAIIGRKVPKVKPFREFSGFRRGKAADGPPPPVRTRNRRRPTRF